MRRKEDGGEGWGRRMGEEDRGRRIGGRGCTVHLR